MTLRTFVFDAGHVLVDSQPQDCVFNDGALHNCLGATAAGMDAIHFVSPNQLDATPQARGLL